MRASRIFSGLEQTNSSSRCSRKLRLSIVSMSSGSLTATTSPVSPNATGITLKRRASAAEICLMTAGGITIEDKSIQSMCACAASECETSDSVTSPSLIRRSTTLFWPSRRARALPDNNKSRFTWPAVLAKLTPPSSPLLVQQNEDYVLKVLQDVGLVSGKQV